MILKIIGIGTIIFASTTFLLWGNYFPDLPSILGGAICIGFDT